MYSCLGPFFEGKGQVTGRYWGECIDKEQPEVNRRALERYGV